ncbi:hypothetical protein HZI73_12230 [Vallitalea pronyensis]|uniref:Uncharacterized protein n=1 Tax=Vallitalea pronyensis TaxID=1348613 RepID=A0A8J8MK97_9FIRM|nr:hypothetical protein [Vallitalea pronyensis]QUI23011.1 hypothetical protein HZI73_12230 [Vallitalea pronyensis]
MRKYKHLLVMFLSVLLFFSVPNIVMAGESDQYYSFSYLKNDLRSQLMQEGLSEEQINDFIKAEIDASKAIAESIKQNTNNPSTRSVEIPDDGGSLIYVGLFDPLTKYTASEGNEETETLLLAQAYADAKIFHNSNHVAAAAYGGSAQAIAWTGFRFTVNEDYYGVTSGTGRIDITYSADHYLVGGNTVASISNYIGVYDVTEGSWILRKMMDVNSALKGEAKSVAFFDKNFWSDDVTFKVGHEYVVTFETKANADFSARVNEIQLLHNSSWSRIHINW